MALIPLVPKSISLNLAVMQGTSPSRSLTCAVQLKHFHNVRLATGGDLSGLHGTLNVFPRHPDAEALAPGSVGAIEFTLGIDYEGKRIPDTYIVKVWVPEVEFADLLATALAGRLPIEVALDIPGIEGWWGPGGPGVVWDNKQHQYLNNIASAAIRVPLE